jgi:hypothetical protein
MIPDISSAIVRPAMNDRVTHGVNPRWINAKSALIEHSDYAAHERDSFGPAVRPIACNSRFSSTFQL